jgi:HEAT repeat protein
MLDDEAIRSRETILHRLISVLGELSVKRSVAPLAAILTDRSVGNLTKAYAANALGRIGEAAGVEALAASLNVKDEMVRRQVAMALGRIDREAVVPHLIRLQGDKSIAVAEVATRALRDWEQKLGQRLGLKGKRPPEKRRKKKLMPAEER